MTLVRRPISESNEQSSKQEAVDDDWEDKSVDVNDSDTLVVADDIPDDTDVEKLERKDDDDEDGKAKEVVLEAMKWGLVPWFTKPQDVAATGSQAINARAETVSQKPFFRHLVNRRRCVVVMDGFFEWKKFEVQGQPRRQAYFVLPNPTAAMAGPEPTQPLLYLAALWDVWTAKDSDEKLVTCTILTTEATAEFGGIHDRMPVVLQPENVSKWLDTDSFKFDQLRHLLAPYKENGLTWYEVTDKVNSVKNKSSENIEPLALHKAKGISRFFAKPKSVDGEEPVASPGFAAPAKPKRVEHEGEDPEDVLVVPSSREGAAKKSPPKKKKIEQLPGQKSLNSFFKK